MYFMPGELSLSQYRIVGDQTIKVNNHRGPITVSLGQGGSPKGLKLSPEGSGEPWKVYLETKFAFENFPWL